MSVNKVILIGNVGKDPEIKNLESGNKVANFTVATTEKGYTTKSGTQMPEKTEWHNIVVWSGLAGVVESYVRKGTKIYIEGKIRTRSWDDQNGVKRYTTEIYADSIELLGNKPEQQPQQQAPQQSYEQAVQQAQHQVQQQMWGETTPPANTPGDDLPF